MAAATRDALTMHYLFEQKVSNIVYLPASSISSTESVRQIKRVLRVFNHCRKSSLARTQADSGGK